VTVAAGLWAGSPEHVPREVRIAAFQLTDLIVANTVNFF
jgi:hypothetical protein